MELKELLVSQLTFWFNAEFFAVGLASFPGVWIRFMIQTHFSAVPPYPEEHPLIMMLNEYPWIVANLVGCFVMGFGMIYTREISDISLPLFKFLTTGLCGCITTFSTWENSIIDTTFSKKNWFVKLSELIFIFFIIWSFFNFSFAFAKSFKEFSSTIDIFSHISLFNTEQEEKFGTSKDELTIEMGPDIGDQISNEQTHLTPSPSNSSNSLPSSDMSCQLRLVRDDGSTFSSPSSSNSFPLPSKTSQSQTIYVHHTDECDENLPLSLSTTPSPSSSPSLLFSLASPYSHDNLIRIVRSISLGTIPTPSMIPSSLSSPPSLPSPSPYPSNFSHDSNSSSSSSSSSFIEPQQNKISSLRRRVSYPHSLTPRYYSSLHPTPRPKPISQVTTLNSLSSLIPLWEDEEPATPVDMNYHKTLPSVQFIHSLFTPSSVLSQSSSDSKASSISDSTSLSFLLSNGPKEQIQIDRHQHGTSSQGNNSILEINGDKWGGTEQGIELGSSPSTLSSSSSLTPSSVTLSFDQCVSSPSIPSLPDLIREGTWTWSDARYFLLKYEFHLWRIAFFLVAIPIWIDSLSSHLQGRGITALALAPFGCWLRWALSRVPWLKVLWPEMHIPTLLANLLGVFINAIILTQARSHPYSFGMSVGFCGSLTTVSTFFAELHTLYYQKGPFYPLRYGLTTFFFSSLLIQLVRIISSSTQ